MCWNQYRICEDFFFLIDPGTKAYILNLSIAFYIQKFQNCRFGSFDYFRDIWVPMYEWAAKWSLREGPRREPQATWMNVVPGVDLTRQFGGSAFGTFYPWFLALDLREMYIPQGIYFKGVAIHDALLYWLVGPDPVKRRGSFTSGK